MPRNQKTVTVFETLVDGPEDGPAGPAGDHTFVHRFRSQKAADDFVKGKTCYGRPPTVNDRQATREQLRRWGLG